MTLTPYLYFSGNCAEAMEAYKAIFGGELSTMPNETGGLMHANLTGGMIHLQSSDGTRTEPYPAGPVSLSLSGSDLAEMTAIYDALSEGATALNPIHQETWGDAFGSLTDRFGIDWQFSVEGAR